MNEKEVVEFVDRHGYNPELRDSGHAIVILTNQGRIYQGLGIHTLRDGNGDVSRLLLIHTRGTMYFSPREIVHIRWMLADPEILAAIA